MNLFLFHQKNKVREKEDFLDKQRCCFLLMVHILLEYMMLEGLKGSHIFVWNTLMVIQLMI